MCQRVFYKCDTMHAMDNILLLLKVLHFGIISTHKVDRMIIKVKLTYIYQQSYGRSQLVYSSGL